MRNNNRRPVYLRDFDDPVRPGRTYIVRVEETSIPAHDTLESLGFACGQKLGKLAKRYPLAALFVTVVAIVILIGIIS